MDHTSTTRNPPRMTPVPDSALGPPALVQAIAKRRGGTLLNLDRMLLRSPVFASGWNGFMGAIRTQLALDPCLRELAICTVAVETNAPYEWSAWVNWAIEAGVPQDTVDAIREGRPPQHLTDEEKLVTDFCMQMISGNHRISEATFNAALAHFGAQGVVELVVTLGYFAMIALPLNAFEIGMSNDQKKLRKPFAPLPVTGTPWQGPAAPRSPLPAIAAPVTTAPRL